MTTTNSSSITIHWSRGTLCIYPEASLQIGLPSMGCVWRLSLYACSVSGPSPHRCCSASPPTISAYSWGAAFSSGSRKPSKKLGAKRWCSPGRFKWLHIRPYRLQPPSMLYYRSRDSFSPSCICMYRTLSGVQSALGFLLHEHLRFGSLWGPWPAGFLSLEVLFKSAPTHPPHIQQV